MVLPLGLSRFSQDRFTMQQRPMKPIGARNEESAVADINVTEVDNEAFNPLRIPAKYKWTALFLVITLPIGHTWTGSALGPLKNTLREELGINNTQFGVISSADAFVNTVFPIIGGLILDWWGPNIVTLCCTSVILVGSIVAAVGVQIGLWRLLVSGHVLMGFGIAVLDSATQKVATSITPQLHSWLMTSSSFTTGLALLDWPWPLGSKVRFPARSVLFRAWWPSRFGIKPGGTDGHSGSRLFSADYLSL